MTSSCKPTATSSRGNSEGDSTSAAHTTTTTTSAAAATTSAATTPSAANTPPARHVLGEATLEAVARYIVERDVRRVLVLLGAGASVAAGIPDFRSPGTGVYAQLAAYGLDDPADAFSLALLRARPEVFYSVARDMGLWPGAYAPTSVHHFVRLLADTGRLLRCCTQNIDGLERAAGVPPALLVEAHGTFATAACVECETAYDAARNRDDALRHHRVSRCAQCGGVVKPGIVFFGESLPESFWSVLQHDTRVAELVLIIGTSLQVHPFAALPLRVAADVPRVVLNMQRIGGRMFRFLDDPPELFAASSSDDNEDDDDDEGDVLYAANTGGGNGNDDDDAVNDASKQASSRANSKEPLPQPHADAVQDGEVAGAAGRGASTSRSGHNTDKSADDNNGGDERDDDSSSSSSSTASSSDGYAQYGEYDAHAPLCRDVLVTGDCQESVQRLAQLLGLGERLTAALASHKQ